MGTSLLLVPLVFGMCLFWVLRTDRRRQFVKQRLLTLTARRDEPDFGSTPLRRNQRKARWGVLLPQRLRAVSEAAFDATGNRIGLPHLLVVGLFAGILVILFTAHVLSLNFNLAVVL